ncbi:MAG TPA: alpha/beta hydrolase [Micromonospora sp.]|nr:alpha/beta hydrolase [Micromonospora sp.]
MALVIEAEDALLPAVLDLPERPARGAVVALHGAEAGHRDFFLYEQLARLLTPAGIAVLRYDRRPGTDGHDVPLAVQAADAHAALQVLRRQFGDIPVGLWGYSQGAWAATAAANDGVAFLVLVAACGISPARQMRFGTAEQLRRHGFGPADIAELTRLRSAVEEHQRGNLPRQEAQAIVDRAASQPWFPLSYVRRQLPERPGSWADMDFDPAVSIAAVSCPVLLFYGETDEWMPVDESIAVWRRIRTANGHPEPTICRLPGCGHEPTTGGDSNLAAVSPLYSKTLLTWLDRQLSMPQPRSATIVPGEPS